MTSEEVEEIKANILSYAASRPAWTIEKLIHSIEATRKESDDAIKDGLVQAVRIDELTETVKVLNERVAEVTAERDALKDRVEVRVEVLELGYRGFP